MQAAFHPLTPQKKSLSLHAFHQDPLLKQLSPLVMTIGSSGFGKVKLEMMQSPLPTSKDLFSQLLASEVKATEEEALRRFEIMEEESSEIPDQVLDNESQESQSESGSFEQDEYDFDGGDDSKKRKRKSTAQLKVLKRELEQESNWDKDKIAEMSTATGLSQSQVYKWWWDQKKKTAKHEKEANRLMKKKLIKKDLSRRQVSAELDSNQESDSGEKRETVAKHVAQLEWHPETARKINKRLTFA